MGCEHDNRFSGVFDLPDGCNGCLACFCEQLQRQIRELESQINNYIDREAEIRRREEYYAD